jgi:hypothetical protein|tara:strand:- start:583 stop:909 length:327 start_codon:yes stop_codon:yes gene_type:complete
MASGTGGWNAGAYGDDGWDDGILLTETGIAATLALGSEQASGGATINQVGYDNLRISVADLSANITGTATVNTVSGITGTSSQGTVKLWSLIDTTSGGDETWTRGVAN